MGFLVGILNGLIVSFQNNQFKRLSGFESYFLNGWRFIAGSLILFVLISIFSLWSIPPNIVFLFVALSLPVEFMGANLYVKAFQYSPQSLIGPLFSLAVLFLVPLQYITLGELPNLLGAMGIVLGLVGSFFLGWDIKNPGVRESLKNIFREKGSYYILGAAFFASLAVVLAKMSYQYAHPLVVGFFIITGLAILHLPFAFRNIGTFPRLSLAPFAKMNFAYGMAMTLHYVGLSLLPAAYYISIKRSSILFDVLLGKLIYNESHFGGRLIGALIMIAGLVLIAIA